MWNYDYDEELSLRDGLYGTVVGGCRTGLFVELENGLVAFSKFGFLENGSKVLCSVVKKANETYRTVVSIDSVLEYGLPVAC